LILSRLDTAAGINGKSLEYLAAGSQEVWVVDHENDEIFVQTRSSVRLVRGSDVLESPLLPGFSQTVADLFAW